MVFNIILKLKIFHADILHEKEDTGPCCI